MGSTGLHNCRGCCTLDMSESFRDFYLVAEAFHGCSSKCRCLTMFFSERAWQALAVSKVYSFPLWQVGVEVGPWWETTESFSISWSGSAALFIMSIRTCWEAPFGHSSGRWGVSPSWPIGHLSCLHKNIFNTSREALKGLKVPHIQFVAPSLAHPYVS